MITKTELMETFLTLDVYNNTVESLTRQAPVPCASCQFGGHMPWWKTVGPLSHLSNEELTR